MTNIELANQVSILAQHPNTEEWIVAVFSYIVAITNIALVVRILSKKRDIQ